MDQIQIDRNNTIQSPDEIKMGQPIWTVGQGGSTSVCKPRFEGYVLAFGTSEYTFLGENERASGFKLKSTDYDDRFISVIRGQYESPTLSKAELASMNIGDGLKPDIDYPLGADRYVNHLSMMDRNIQGGGYNNWYLCDSEEKAMAVYEEMLSKWTNEHQAAADDHSNKCRSWFY